MATSTAPVTLNDLSTNMQAAAKMLAEADICSIEQAIELCGRKHAVRYFGNAADVDKGFRHMFWSGVDVDLSGELLAMLTIDQAAYKKYLSELDYYIFVGDTDKGPLTIVRKYDIKELTK